jgi:DNA-binding LytR/AlgR family response regulator
MEKAIKILIVEDEMIIAANTSLQLSKLGYEVTGIVSRGEEVLKHIANNQPDIVLLDIHLKGSLDGIETAKMMQEEYDIPIIYLTANTNDAFFNRAKETRPFAFISKPFKKLEIERAIELTINRIMEIKASDEKLAQESGNSAVLDDRIFVRHNDKMVKLFIRDILYIEAERNYCRIFSKEKEYLLVMTLKDIDIKLPTSHFLRIHRSYIVNVSQVEEVAIDHLVIGNKALSISKTYKDELLRRLNTI